MAAKSKVVKGIVQLLKHGRDEAVDVADDVAEWWAKRAATKAGKLADDAPTNFGEYELRSGQLVDTTPAAPESGIKNKVKDAYESVGDAIDNLRHRNSYQVDEIDRDKARELYDHYFGTAHAKQEMQRVSQGLRSDAEIQRAIKEYDAIMADDAQQLVDMGLTPPHKMSQMEYDAFFPGWGTKPTVEAPKTPLQTKPDWRDLGKWGVGTGLGLSAMSQEAEAGYGQLLVKAKRKLRNLYDQLAQFKDAPGGGGKREKQLTDEIVRTEAEVERLDGLVRGNAIQGTGKPTGAAVWGPDSGAMQMQEMMDRYGDVKGGMGTDPRQMELRLGLTGDLQRDALKRRYDKAGYRDGVYYQDRNDNLQMGNVDDLYERSMNAQHPDITPFNVRNPIESTETLERRKALLRRQMEMNENYPGDYDWD